MHLVRWETGFRRGSGNSGNPERVSHAERLIVVLTYSARAERRAWDFVRGFLFPAPAINGASGVSAQFASGARSAIWYFRRHPGRAPSSDALKGRRGKRSTQTPAPESSPIEALMRVSDEGWFLFRPPNRFAGLFLGGWRSFWADWPKSPW